MFDIVSIDEIVVFDEYDWDTKTFSPHDLAINIIDNETDKIDTIAFLNRDRIIHIVFRHDKPTAKAPSYYFRDPSSKLLNHLCKFEELRLAVKKYVLATKILDFSAAQYPYLTALILGKNDDK